MEFLYVLGNILTTTRYGAISSRIGKVKNMLVGVAFSNCELFSNLELTQAVYDQLKGEESELPFPLEDEVVITAVKESAQLLSGNVIGLVTWITTEEVASLVTELNALYSDEAAFAEQLKQLDY